jgi:hypothetical protein
LATGVRASGRRAPHFEHATTTPVPPGEDRRRPGHRLSRSAEDTTTGGPYVADACFKCFRCFGGMFQVFYIDVAKVYRDIAHAARVSKVCCKCSFEMFHLFQTYVASVLYGCCTCFRGYTHILQASI